MRYRAVVFDLWQTLVPWPAASAEQLYASLADRFAAPRERFVAAWRRGRATREVGPIADSMRALAAEFGFAGDLEPILALRRQWTLDALVPREDALSTLAELRRRGRRLGLITVCSQDVPDVWEQTPFSGAFDATVFSCSVGISKPDPRVYAIAAERLAVAPEDCLFVGDGANDELPGAQRAGMAAVQLRPPGEELTPEGERWTGPVIETLSELLEVA